MDTDNDDSVDSNPLFEIRLVLAVMSLPVFLPGIRTVKDKSQCIEQCFHCHCCRLCGVANQRKRGLARFSLRRLLYSSPLVARRITRGSSSTSKNSKNAGDGRGSGPSRDVERGEAVRLSSVAAAGTPLHDDLQQAPIKIPGFGTSAGKSGELGIAECPLCLAELPMEYFPELSTCSHRSCYDCFQQYLRIEISESRVNIACPECSEPMHPNDIRMILNDKAQYEKYEDFMVRRVLAVYADTRWCPAPDCSYAVIAAGCASCPKIKCERPGCDAYFCYHCKAEWHPNQTCDAARAQRSPNVRSSSPLPAHILIKYGISLNAGRLFKQAYSLNLFDLLLFVILPDLQSFLTGDDIKPCPRCQVLIVKMDDGSCNHMTCAVCGAEFCWLCMKEISDLHYLSPSGCTFWGKKPWSRKKKILWQLGTLVGAPVGIGLVAGIAVPAMIIGIPVWVGRKLYARYEHANKHKRNLAIAGGVTAATVLVSTVDYYYQCMRSLFSETHISTVHDAALYYWLHLLSQMLISPGTPRDGATFYQVFPNSSSKSHVALTGGSDHENVPVYVHRMRCQGKFLPGCGNLYKKCFD
ncbi:hypothetical protein Cfor_11865 [Coptotermes formosanus]|uniref:RBR-type E3 ubiquitin transferase n=1 Tax=Coptotermes formosanus TaxID=36987 RepID=A0A6L2QEW8_COPFO|nr:hypothetical protein Cfor_11865 [Coptotermes formosanus]